MKNNCCHIVGAGDFSPSLIKTLPGDIVIACDNGYSYLENAGIKCHFCIGDFDSLGNVPKGDFHTTVLPTVKDVTDTHAACDKALSMGFKKIKIYGALGGSRFSHSIANLQLICHLCDLGCEVMIIDKNCTVIPLKDGEIAFPKEQKGYVSVFAMSGKVKYSCEGLKYTVKDHPLSCLFALGVSNEFTGVESKIQIHGGIGIIVLE